jgi:hypothetical protein
MSCENDCEKHIIHGTQLKPETAKVGWNDYRNERPIERRDSTWLDNRRCYCQSRDGEEAVLDYAEHLAAHNAAMNWDE